MKNSEAVEVLKEWKVLVDGIHKESKLLKPETQKDLKAKSESLQLAIEAMSEVEALKHDYARILDLLSESVNGVTPTEEA